ncbi:MAG: aminopeptidase P N-terminal domain-containing protein [Betaproteobacteria bacterium]|nr:aminopeptidase P N-terminal domain-containing protein [Betaproteobacteria bacterium]
MNKPNPTIRQATFAARRARFIESMGRGIAVIPTAPETVRNRDSHFPYRNDSYFHYLSGFTEPEAVLVLIAGESPKSILFCREKNAEREVWDGFRFGPEAAREAFAMDEAQTIATLDETLPKLMADQPTIFTPLGLDPAWDRRIIAALNGVRAQIRTGISAPAVLHDARDLLDRMRLLKDEEEIALMQRAADISVGAHTRAMARTRPGWFEYQVEAELTHEFLRHGALSPAYPSIVASGPGACVLHYRANDRQMAAGELRLIDAGCELQGYASDITRSFPVGKAFTGPQREVYELVLAAQAACIEALAPGRPFHDYHDVAEKVLAQGLIDLRLCQGTLDAVLETGDFKRFYMHRAGHWLGLDVHDAGAYREAGQSLPLAPGMVLTVEPGCYIRPAENVDERFWNIGVRIEDDLLITATGTRNLTAAAPKTVADIEALRRDALGNR